jgi:transposase
MSNHGPFAAGAGGDIIDAILYVLHSGCPWRMIPDSFAARSTVSGSSSTR